MTTITWLRGVHILAVAVAFGANATYGVWIALGSRGSDEQLVWVLRCLERIDTWLANGAWWLAFLTGIALAHALGIDIGTPWLLVSIGLFLTAMVLAHVVYTPTLKLQIATLDREGRSALYHRIAARSQAIGIAMFVLALAVFALMLARPSF